MLLLTRMFETNIPVNGGLFHDFIIPPCHLVHLTSGCPDQNTNPMAAAHQWACPSSKRSNFQARPSSYLETQPHSHTTMSVVESPC